MLRILGFGLMRPKQATPGLDVAGIVIAVGSAVSRFSVGDEVFGIANGSCAQYTVANEEKLVLKPSDLPFDVAGGSQPIRIASRRNPFMGA